MYTYTAHLFWIINTNTNIFFYTIQYLVRLTRFLVPRTQRPEIIS